VYVGVPVIDYCKGHGLVQTRSRAYKKNDQAWVEQKNGSIVRRLVGYGRLNGVEATKALATLYASSRKATAASLCNNLSTEGSSWGLAFEPWTTDSSGAAINRLRRCLARGHRTGA
jgi:hypothetical protein